MSRSLEERQSLRSGTEHEDAGADAVSVAT